MKISSVKVIVWNQGNHKIYKYILKECYNRPFSNCIFLPKRDSIKIIA